MAGRKSSWDTKIKPRLEEIKAWARDGHTEKQMCDALGISHETFYKFKRINTEMSDALKVNKAIADLNVENSLYKRAIGYEYKEITKDIKTDSSGKVISKHAKEITKVVLPDTTAQIFWLKNRKPGVWRDKQQHEVSGVDGEPIESKWTIEIVDKENTEE